MPVRRLILAAVCTLLLGLPCRLAAQRPAARDSAVARLHSGQQIRLTTGGSGRLSGRAGVASADTLDLAQDDAVRRIPIPAIDTIWVRGRATKTGLVTGAIVGALFGGFVGAVGAGLCEYDCSTSPGAATVVGGAIGAAAGAGLGALIGAAIPKWKRQFP